MSVTQNKQQVKKSSPIITFCIFQSKGQNISNIIQIHRYYQTLIIFVMIYKETKTIRVKPEDWKLHAKARQLQRSDKQNKDNSKIIIKNDIVTCFKQEKPKLNITAQLKKEEKKTFAISGDISSVLKAISKNSKNKTLRLQRETEMTEEDINKLFGEDHKKQSTSKSKLHKKLQQKTKVSKYEQANNFSQTDTKLLDLKTKSMKFQINQLIQERKDFADSIKFLVQQESDRMLQALGQNGLYPVEPDPKIDKTGKFKQEFVVGKEVGEGAYAVVRVAIWTTLNKKVAIKIYQKRKINEPQRKRSVRREVKILQRIDHPNILKIHDAVQTNNHVNIIMEYVPGVSLGSLLKNQPYGKLVEKQARIIFSKIVDAVKYLHQMQVTHRDIKLDNIIVDANFEPKLIDFGFATCMHNSKKVKMFCGTPSFMAPQIVLKKEYRGPPSDMWALGVLLYVMITGVFPFKGSTDKELYDKICASEYSKPIVSKPLSNIIQGLLTVEADQRLTAEEVLEHIWIKKVEIKETQDSTFNRGTSKDFRVLEDVGQNQKQVRERRAIQTLRSSQLRDILNLSRKCPSKPSTCTNREALKFQFPQHKQSPKISRLTNLAYL